MTVEWTRREKILRTVMLLYAIAFIVTDLIFLFASPQLYQIMNYLGSLLGLPPSPGFKERFYLDLTNSMMVMITYISLAIYFNPRKNLCLMPVLILSKYTSSIFGILFFIFTEKYFSYIVIFLTDFPLAVIATYLYLWVRKERA